MTDTLRYFFDTEFMEDGTHIDLLSIGVVCEDGRKFYAEVVDADLSLANDWVKENVIPHLWRIKLEPTEIDADVQGGVLPHEWVGLSLRAFIEEGGAKPEFWAYYADYDWVALCRLYGRMLDLPDYWPKFCMDLKQLAVMLGNPRLPEQSGTVHHALADAEWNAEVYDYLMDKADPDASSDDTLPTPGEWKAHRAFYRLTVSQRNAAWGEIEALRSAR